MRNKCTVLYTFLLQNCILFDNLACCIKKGTFLLLFCTKIVTILHTNLKFALVYQNCAFFVTILVHLLYLIMGICLNDGLSGYIIFVCGQKITCGDCSSQVILAYNRIGSHILLFIFILHRNVRQYSPSNFVCIMNFCMYHRAIIC